MPGRKRDMPAAAAADGRDRCHAQTARTDGHAAKTCSGPIKLPIPFDEARDAGLDRRGGLEADVMHQGIDVGVGGGHVALLQRYHVFFRFFTQALLDPLDVMHELHGLVVADVVEPIGRAAAGGVGRIAAPVRIRRGDFIARAHHAFDDVVDVGEVALVLAVVVDVDGLAFEDVLGELEQRHVGPAPRTVHGEEAQSRGGQAVEMAVGVRHQLVRFLGGGVEAHGVVDVVMHREGHISVRAVHRARRGVDEVLDAVMTAALQDIQKTDDVAVDVGARVFDGVAHAGLGGEVHHALRLVLGEHGLDGGAVLDIGAHVDEARMCRRAREPRLLEIDVVVVIEVVDDAHLAELTVVHGENHRIVFALLERANQLESIVFVFDLVRVGPWVVNVHLRVKAFELFDDVDGAGVADVGAVFLEGQAQYEHFRVDDRYAAPRHHLHHTFGDMRAHVVVDAAAGEDDLRVVADLLRLVREVVGIDADAVAADQAGPEGQEVPLAASGLEHLEGVDAHAMEQQREFIDQRDVDVALRVFDDLRGLGDADAARLVRAGRDDAAIHGVDIVSDFRRGARGHLDYGVDAVLLIARVDALGAVADEEGLIEFEARLALDDGHAVFLGAARVHGGFIHHHVVLLEGLDDRVARADERVQVRTAVAVARRRHGDDVEVAVFQGRHIGGHGEAGRGLQLVRLDLERAVAARVEFGDARLVDVEAHHRQLLAELHRERQPHVTQADHANLGLADIEHSELPLQANSIDPCRWRNS